MGDDNAMNSTAIAYLNKNNHDHQQAYNNYIKDCLMSAKPLEMGIKDFMPKKIASPVKRTQVKRTQKPKKDTIKMTIEEVTNYIQKMYNIFNDHQKDMEEQGKYKEATEAWREKQAYEILLYKIYGKESEWACNVPNYATWKE